MKPVITVVICTHNPRPVHLADTLAALRAQTAPRDTWDLLVIDNASSRSLAGTLDLSWHPSARVLREDRLGTAHARHRALREVPAGADDLILFVDDDNLLAPDYLARGLELGLAWPQLGCWGGQLLPRYETAPGGWIEPYLKYLAVLPLDSDQWTNVVVNYDSVPPTAGCFLRAPVWRRYLELVAHEPRRLELGARGPVQVRGEDTDLILTALDLGLGLGRFQSLRLTHLIPRGRLTPGYVAHLIEGTALGTGLLEYLRFQRRPRPLPTGLVVRALQHWRTWRLPEPARSIRRAELRGRALARATVQGWHAAAATAAFVQTHTVRATSIPR